MEETLFEKIANRTIPSFKVWENEEFYAFLDIHPRTKGHTLVIPKKNEGDYVFDLENELYTRLLLAAKEVAILLKEKIPCARVLMIAEGFEVPHVHIKLIPAALGFSLETSPSIDTSMEELAQVAELFK